MQQYYDKIVRGTSEEDNRMIVQFLKTKLGKKFQFLNYYKEMPVSYDATLLSVDNDMAEFELHAYQAKVINIERKALIYSPEGAPFKEDIVGEAFYINASKKKVILNKFEYAKIRSDMRRFVRVILDRPIEAEVILEGETLKTSLKDISLGGALMSLVSVEGIEKGMDVNLNIKLPDLNNRFVNNVSVTAAVISVIGDTAPYGCIVEFYPEKQSQQHISYYVNQRQVEIIKELKDLTG